MLLQCSVVFVGDSEDGDAGAGSSVKIHCNNCHFDNGCYCGVSCTLCPSKNSSVSLYCQKYQEELIVRLIVRLNLVLISVLRLEI